MKCFEYEWGDREWDNLWQGIFRIPIKKRPDSDISQKNFEPNICDTQSAHSIVDTYGNEIPHGIHGSLYEYSYVTFYHNIYHSTIYRYLTTYVCSTLLLPFFMPWYVRTYGAVQLPVPVPVLYCTVLYCTVLYGTLFFLGVKPKKWGFTEKREIELETWNFVLRYKYRFFSFGAQFVLLLTYQQQKRNDHCLLY